MAGLHFGSRGGGDADPASGTFMASTMQDFDSGFSVRRLRQGYLGSAMRVQRHSDDAELDIGFLPNGWLDVFALLEFAGTGIASVKTWYDQGASATNGTMATRAQQPVIVESGVLVMDNGMPALKFTDTALSKLSDIDLPFLDDDGLMSLFCVISPNGGDFSSGNPRGIVGKQSPDVFGSFGYGYANNSNQFRLDVRPSASMGTFLGNIFTDADPAPIVNGEQVQHTFVYNGTSAGTVKDKAQFYVNGGAEIIERGPYTIAPASDEVSYIGASHPTVATTHFNGLMQEIVYWKANKTAQRAGVENNQAAFFTI